MSWTVASVTTGSYQDLLRQVGIYLGWGANFNAWDDTQLGMANAVVQRGVRRFYSPVRLPGERQSHEWSFLRPLAVLTTTAPYDTGTITIAAGVVTLTSGTWPSAAASGELTVNGATYTVATRDSSTQITLDDTSVAVSSATSYTLGYPTVTLPSDFADFDGPLTYDPGTSVLFDPIMLVSEHQIRHERQGGVTHTRPTRAALRPAALDPTVGTRYEVVFNYTPDDAYRLNYRYRVHPSELTTTNNMPYGGTAHYHTILDAVLAEAELQERPGERVRQAQFSESLRSSVDHDRRVNSPDTLGYNRDRSNGEEWQDPARMSRGTRLVPYNGVYY